MFTHPITRPRLLGIVLLVLSASATAQVPQWTARFNATMPADDQTNSIVVDPDQNAYYVGTNDAGWEVRKVSPAGDVLWHWHGSGLYMNGYLDIPKAIGFDAAGNLTLIADLQFARLSPDGQTFSIHAFDFRATPGSVALTPAGELYVVGSLWNADGDDVLVAKYSPQGQLLWERVYDGPWHGSDAPSALTIGPAGDIWIAGRSQTRTGLRKTTFALLVLRYSADGDLRWDRQIQLDPAKTNEWLTASDIVVDSTGIAFVIGTDYSDSQNQRLLMIGLQPNGETAWIDAEIPHAGQPRVLLDETRDALFVAAHRRVDTTYTDILLIRYHRDGSRQWTATFDDIPDTRAAFSVATIDGRGIIHLLGSERGPGTLNANLLLQYDGDGQLMSVVRRPYESSNYGRLVAGAVDREGNASIAVTAFENFVDSRAIRFAADGTQEWSQLFSTFVGSEEDFIDAAVAPDGGLYIVGRSSLRAPGNSNVLQRYSASGNLEWQQRLPADCLTSIGAVLSDNAGNAVVVGTPAAQNTYRVGLSKYAPSGQPLWFGGYFGALNIEDLPQRVGLDSAGNVLVCGTLEYHYDSVNYDFEGTLLSFSPSGALRWERAVNGSNYHTLDALAVDPGGGCVVAGTFRTGLIPSILVARFSADGQELWRRQFDHPDAARLTNVRAIRLLSDGAACVLVNALEVSRHVEKSAVFVVDASGHLRGRCDISLSSESGCYSRDVLVIESDDVFVLSTDWNPDGENRLLLTRITTNGAIDWSRVIPVSPSIDEGSAALAELSGGDLVIASGLNDTTTGRSWAATRRVDPAGTVRWMDMNGTGGRILTTSDGGFISAGGAYSPETRGDFAATRYGPPPPRCGTIDPCAADATGDCLVDISDLATVLSQFGAVPALGFAPANGDIDFDTDVDIQDLAQILSALGTNCR